MAGLKAAPLWLIRFNAILLWLNPALGLIAVILALLVIAAAGERWPRGGTGAAPPVIRLAEASPRDLCRQAKLPEELRDLYLHD